MKIGIFGGAFNPIHNGHLHLLDEFYRAEMPFGQFDKLLIIPTANPPHKSSDGLISAEHRIAELESTEKSYTYTTLVKLKKIYPDAEFVLFIGSDQLFYFPKWYRYKDILKLAEVRAITRQECERQAVADFLAKDKEFAGINALVAKPVVVSSTQIRQMVSKGESIADLVPPSVNGYIKEHRLYV